MEREDQFIPHVVVSDGLAALEFYKETFGGTDGHNVMAADGKRLMHGEVVLDGTGFLFRTSSRRARADAAAAGERRAGLRAHNGRGRGRRCGVRTQPALGASVVMPVQDMFWGARYGKFIDPFGHEWGVNQQMVPEDQSGV